jgi:hypothetical protein
MALPGAARPQLPALPVIAQQHTLPHRWRYLMNELLARIIDAQGGIDRWTG